MSEEPEQFCSKIKYNDHMTDRYGENRLNIIFGIITSEDTDFITVQTAKKSHRLNKKNVISIEQTNKTYHVGWEERT